MNTGCNKCEGAGYIYQEESEVWEECSCLLRSRALDYLTPKYENVPWDKKFNPDPWCKSIVYQGQLDAFNKRVKSVLLNTGMRYSHTTVTPYEIMVKYLTPVKEDNGEAYLGLNRYDILIIKCSGDDPHNKDYSPVLLHILDLRGDSVGRWTWIQTPIHPSSPKWFGKYGEGFKDRVLDINKFKWDSRSGTDRDTRLSQIGKSNYGFSPRKI